MVTLADSWFGSSISTIHLNTSVEVNFEALPFDVLPHQVSGRVYMIIFPSDLASAVELNFDYGQTRGICLDWPSAPPPHNQIGSEPDVWYYSAPFKCDPDTRRIVLPPVDITFPITRSSDWTALIFYCENRVLHLIDSAWAFLKPDEYRKVSLQGSLTMENPFGFESASSFPLQVFLTIVQTLCYSVALLVWCWKSYHFSQDLHFFQKIAFLLFILAILDSALDLTELHRANSAGYISSSLTFLSIVVWSILCAAIRYVLLMLIVGSHITSESVSKATKMFALFLSGSYIIISVSNNASEIAPVLTAPSASAYFHIVPLSETRQLINSILLVPTALINIIYVLWLFYGIEKTINKMKWSSTRQRNEHKIQLYDNLQIVIFIASVVGGALTLVKFLSGSITVGASMDANWIFDALWRGFYCLFALLIAFWLLTPSPDNHKLSNIDPDDPNQPAADLPQTIPVPDADDSDSDTETVVEGKGKDSGAHQRASFLKGLKTSLPELFRAVDDSTQVDVPEDCDEEELLPKRRRTHQRQSSDQNRIEMDQL